VIFGIMFALYGLKPILQAVYGEDTVESGAVYESDDLTLEWVGYTLGAAANPRDVPPEGTETVGVYLDASAREQWSPAPADVRLEISSQHEWIVARPETVDGQHEVAPGEFKNLLFVFWVPLEAQPFEIRSLHIAKPRLEMEPPEQPRPSGQDGEAPVTPTPASRGE
jgi:hypothetical protein